MIDFKKIEDIVAGDNDYLHEMLMVYLDEGHKMLQDLEAALFNNDASGLRLIVHSQAASASLLHTYDLQDSLEYCRDLVLTHGGSVEQKKIALQKSQALFEDIRKQIRVYLEQV